VGRSIHIKKEIFMNVIPAARQEDTANSKNRTPNPIITLGLLLAGGLLVGFSAGSWQAPLAAWIGPALIMRYTRDYKTWRGFIPFFIVYTLAFVVGFGAMWSANWGLPLTSGLAIGYGFLWTLPYLADRVISPRLPGFSSTFVYPLAATTLEFLNIHTNPVGAWGATGFTQYGNLALMQLASITGMIGITFLMGWFASVVNWTLENRANGATVLKGLTAFSAVVSAVLVFGYLRLNMAPLTESDETIRVAGITAQGLASLGERITKLPDRDPASPAIRELVQEHWDLYLEETAREAKAGAKLILWPEISGITVQTDEALHVTQAQEIARQHGVYLALPLLILEPGSSRWLENKLLLIDPSGEVAVEYFKFGGAIFESTQVGDGKLQTLTTPFGVLSGAICYDMDYPAVIQQAGWNGTGLMLVPSSDWIEIDPIHAHMAVFRAIENGMSLVRQTDHALSIATDPYGRVLAQTDYFGATDRTLVAQVPVKNVTTIYALFGRWFDWVCVAGFIYTVGWSLIAHRKRT
jgi:apolipoprotein N-acyltransferase